MFYGEGNSKGPEHFSKLLHVMEHADIWGRWWGPSSAKWHQELSETWAAVFTLEKPLMCATICSHGLEYSFFFLPCSFQHNRKNSEMSKMDTFYPGNGIGSMQVLHYQYDSYPLFPFKEKKECQSPPFLIYHWVLAVFQSSYIIHAIKSLQQCKIRYPTFWASKSAFHKL